MLSVNDSDIHQLSVCMFVGQFHYHSPCFSQSLVNVAQNVQSLFPFLPPEPYSLVGDETYLGL